MPAISITSDKHHRITLVAIAVHTQPATQEAGTCLPAGRRTAHMGRVLTGTEISDFQDAGFVRLEHAFEAETVAAVRADLESRLGVSFTDSATWPRPRITLAEVMTSPPYTDAATPRLAGALDDLLGAGRWRPIDYMGWWQITFPGFEVIDYGDDWHVDGSAFIHRPWSGDLRIFPLFLFSDIAANGGGTLLDVGSHRRVAEVLWRNEPAGLDPITLSQVISDLPASRSTVVEATGTAGDIVLCHPMIFHASNRNDGAVPRVQATPHVVAATAGHPGRRPFAPVDQVIWDARPESAP
jgi:Phytanoyl-CoA dioxygenase (PhyH)